MSDILVTDKKIAVLMGGTSEEREVSLRSGQAIFNALKEMGYNCQAVDVGPDITDVLRKQQIEFAFLALHGGKGENGAMQGLLEVLGIPYTGSGILASALAMDKEASKKIFAFSGIPVAPSLIIACKSGEDALSSVAHDEDSAGIYYYPDFPMPNFLLPWVVKPADEGSSIGVSMVKDAAELRSCLEKTFVPGRRVMVEKYIRGREIHICILGDRVLGGVEVRPSTEFYDYDAKYTAGMTEYVIPPELDYETYERVKSLALRACMVIGCTGISRVDFMVDDDGIPHILEVNTLPGMTATSLVPKIAASAGMSFNDLIREMIRLAIN
ncbi:MAG: D-alanine--D-alanine ligase [Nitrospira sp.]|nr:D-alanine--D-alanine ligase [bacterium]MBL7048199.1 D-alanine--D-alanine ligase [Nitrospira sp.]